MNGRDTMDYHEQPIHLEFLDWTGVEDQERKRVLRFLSDDFVKIPGKVSDNLQYDGRFQQQYHTQQPIRNVVPPQTVAYPPPQHLNSNHINYVPVTVVQPIYPPQGYQISLPYAYPGQGDQYAAPFPNKINQNPLSPQQTVVTVNNYIPQANVTMQLPPPVILQKPPQRNVTVNATTIVPQQHVAVPVKPPSMINQVPVQATSQISQTNVGNTSTDIVKPAALPPKSNNTNLADQSPVVKTQTTPQQKQNGTESNAAPQNKSWASLFNKDKREKEEKTGNIVVNGCGKVEESPVTVEQCDDEFSAIKKKLKAKYDDPTVFRVGEFLLSHILDSRTISLQPRGLINRSNYCYINSILQALLACPPMYNLLSGMSKDVTNDKEHLPMISGMSRLVREFHHLPAGQRVGRRIDKNQKKEQNYVSINCDAPFEPSWIYKMLSGRRSDSFVVEGRQEDAEEFLGCLLNGLNDEMLDLIKLVSTSMPKAINSDSGQDQSEWQVMGPKNKGSITRRTEFNRTPISDIFGGLLRSRIHKTGEQDTDNIQPFFTLQLNIEEVNSVKEALEALVSKNQLEGVTSSKTNEEVEAWQQVTIEELPVVLVLHLKCFDFKLDGCTKIVKALEFPVDLKIDNKLLSSKSSLSVKEKQYKLFAVVYHDGKEATKGHYVTDAYHVGYASWLRYDDASVKAVQEEHVLKPQGTRVPYLLFYRRSDSIKSK